MVELKDIDIALAAYLLDIILKKRGNPTYKEVALALSDRLGRTINPHYNLAGPLGTVSTLCHELGLPLISARVQYSGTTTAKTIGKGFYPLACELKPEYKDMDPALVWKRELQLIRECPDWSRLQNYLDGIKPVEPAAIASAAKISNPFSDWLARNTALSERSAGEYSDALDAVSKELQRKGTIQKPIENMTLFELDLTIFLALDDPDFMAKSIHERHMYSSALKQYRYFINSVAEDAGDGAYIERIRNDAKIPETERKAIIQARVGQGIFRKALFEKYHGHCIITGIDHPSLLVASHIKPWSVSSNAERLSVDNGLLLSATYDRLFDNGLITFDPHGKIFLSSLIGAENLKRLNLSKDMQFDLRISGNMGEYLDYHNDMLFVK